MPRSGTLARAAMTRHCHALQCIEMGLMAPAGSAMTSSAVTRGHQTHLNALQGQLWQHCQNNSLLGYTIAGAANDWAHGRQGGGE